MSFALYLEPEVHEVRHTLPGAMRQRVRRLLEDLPENPRPDLSRPLDVRDLDLASGVELRRIRIERWRIVYAVNDTEQWVWVLAVRQRPPYNYADLAELARRLQS
jgi:mRNA-degrading endonuclease RelE of RelBE toxin-antitoxin system